MVNDFHKNSYRYSISKRKFFSRYILIFGKAFFRFWQRFVLWKFDKDLANAFTFCFCAESIIRGDFPARYFNICNYLFYEKYIKFIDLDNLENEIIDLTFPNKKHDFKENKTIFPELTKYNELIGSEISQFGNKIDKINKRALKKDAQN